MSERNTEKAVQEFFQWYLAHKDEIPRESIEKRMEFLETVTTNLTLLFTYFANDLQAMKYEKGMNILQDSQFWNKIRAKGA